MHAISFLSRWLGDFTVIGHRSRALALMKAVQSLLLGGRLSLTHLGRHRRGAAHVKHHIKSMDRLLGNQHLHGERDGIYRAIAATLLHDNRKPVIVVDWSDFELGREWLMLKAAVPVGGRAVTLYERVFPFKRYNSPSAHREFLQALARIVPARCRPILVTDAGFRGPWFQDVEALGWDWVGRLRSGIKYFNGRTGRWCLTASLYRQATPVTQYLGRLMLSRRKKYHARLYLVRAYQPRRGRPSERRHRKPRYRRLHRAPWLLATSLPHDRLSCRRVKQLYGRRMQIEETFRDLKNHRWGMGLRYARSRSGKRLEILLLIAALATLLQWLFGVMARQHGLARWFQANTERRRPVLSLVFLGQQLLLRLDRILPNDILEEAFLGLRELLAEARAS